ncbi:MAG: hypothetical protein M1839_003783 [Geoglossum umbratile]|nr:MAG: hypothetical protein M1839_003783 [Geoglossum umbratile]
MLLFDQPAIVRRHYPVLADSLSVWGALTITILRLILHEFTAVTTQISLLPSLLPKRPKNILHTRDRPYGRGPRERPGGMTHGDASSPGRNASTSDQLFAEKFTPVEAEIEHPLANGEMNKPANKMAYEMEKQYIRGYMPAREIPAVLKPQSTDTRELNGSIKGHPEPLDRSPELYEVKRKPPWALQPPKSAIILPIDSSEIGSIKFTGCHPPQDWKFEIRDNTISAFYMREAARRLRTSDVPVAFPTETVYGLGADATRSEAVQGIYKAKQRPLDNPLIVHICSLSQLKKILQPEYDFDNIITGIGNTHDNPNGSLPQELDPKTVHLPTSPPCDPLPDIYKPLIKKFWPGPLTIILPSPQNSKLAPEVTAGLSTFGARMPKSSLALALIQMAGVPLAAPSANASTKPSPTTAEHVKHDLEGRIDLILDGGPCDVGVESTVVDGLSRPPVILRPGGVSIEQLRACEGWEDVRVGYRDFSEEGTRPRAPGMKYKHYSPKARVVLHKAGSAPPDLSGMRGSVGVIRTRNWPVDFDLDAAASVVGAAVEDGTTPSHKSLLPALPNLTTPPPPHPPIPSSKLAIYSITLGPATSDIARGLFAALRDLDSKGVETIFVEGIADEGDIAAAVMNRLRKAAG